MLRQGDVDVAVIEEHSDEAPALDDLDCRHLLDDPYRVVLPRGHRLAGRGPLDLADLADEAWVETLCGADCSDQVSREAFGRAGFVPRRAVEASEYWPAQSFVAAGLGIALIPTLALGARHQGVVVRRLRPTNEPVRGVWALTRPAVSGGKPVQVMVAALAGAATAHLAGLQRNPHPPPAP
jgi:DNA-binding transcriptional LysR family regulator